MANSMHLWYDLESLVALLESFEVVNLSESIKIKTLIYMNVEEGRKIKISGIFF